MNYYKLRRSNLISDIFSPFNGKGYNVEHPGVQRAPIGALNNRYLRRRAYTNRHANGTSTESQRYTVVPPLQALYGEISQPSIFTKMTRPIVNVFLLLLAVLTGIASGLKSLSTRDHGYHIDETQPASSRLKLAIPIILLVVGLIWLLSALPIHNPSRSNNGINAQTIPVTPLTATSNSSNNSGNSSNNGSNTSQAAQGLEAGASGIPAGLGNQGDQVGGRGGGGSGGGPLPLNLALPPVDIGADGKQILNTNGTDITVN